MCWLFDISFCYGYFRFAPVLYIWVRPGALFSLFGLICVTRYGHTAIVRTIRVMLLCEESLKLITGKIFKTIDGNFSAQ